MPVFNNALAGAAGSGGAAAYEIERSLRFNSGDSAYLDRTPSAAGNRKTWTWAGWVKRSKLGTTQRFFATFDGSNQEYWRFDSNDTLRLFESLGTLQTTQVFRDVSAWYHIVVAVDTTQATASDRIKFYLNGIQVTTFSTATYPSQNADGRFNSAVAHYLGTGTVEYFDGYLADVHFIDGLTPSTNTDDSSGSVTGTPNAEYLTDFGEFDATTGVWNPKAYSGTYGTNGFHLDFSDNSSNAALGTDSSGNSNTWTVNNLIAERTANGTYGATISNSTLNYDPSVIFDGVITSSYQDRPTNNTTVTFTGIPTASTSLRIGVHYIESGTMTTNGSLTVVNATSAIYSAAWYEPQNITYPFTLTSLTVNGGSASHGFGIGAIEVDGVVLDNGSGVNTDQLLDSPTNYEASSGNNGGNYATLNPLQNGGLTLANGNLDVSKASTNWRLTTGTIGISSGKFYWEYTATTASDNHIVGICDTEPNIQTYIGEFTPGWAYQTNGRKTHNNVFTNTTAANSGGEIIQIAVDMDAGKIWFGINNTYIDSGNPSTGANPAYSNVSGTVLPAISLFGTISGSFNFGARPFAYTPPTGFKSLCTQNFDDPLIADGSTAFDVALYTGNSSTQTISGLGFSPDFVWLKARNAAYFHRAYDIVRGATKELYPDDTAAENTTIDGLTSFDSNGFTLGAHAGINQSTTTYVGWAWDAGSSTVSNTDGSITSSVRANQTAGFSIVSYTGTGTANDSVGHGLNAAPELIITKNRDDSTYSWRVFTTAIDGSLDRLFLNATSSKADQTGVNVPTSSVFYVGSNLDHNKSGDNIIAYCFAPVEGYSAFGSYTGNGSTTAGPFIYTGFRSRWLLIKRSNSTDNWAVYDTARDPENRAESLLRPNTSGAEDSSDIYNRLDILSNGFQIRPDNTTYGLNVNGGEFIYAAFAENPFKIARAR